MSHILALKLIINNIFDLNSWSSVIGIADIEVNGEEFNFECIFMDLSP